MISKLRRISVAWRSRALPHNLSGLRAVKAYYSQFGEDAVVANLFGPFYGRGYYVDIGCFHPSKWSNTYGFYLKGWRGLCVDPNEEYNTLWRKMRPGDTHINVGISETPGRGVYIRNKRRAAENYIKDPAECIAENMDQDRMIDIERLDMVLERNISSDTTIDLMSIDCEGHDLRVLRSNDFKRFRPRILIVEDHEGIGDSKLSEYCIAEGFELVSVCHISHIYKDSRWAGKLGGLPISRTQK